MKCPNCNCDLLMTERMGIEVDYCPTCRGVWLDRGELDKFIEQADRSSPLGPPSGPPTGPPTGPPSGPATASNSDHYNAHPSYANRKAYRDDDDDDDNRSSYGRGKKRESLWSKLFDFD